MSSPPDLCSVADIQLFLNLPAEQDVQMLQSLVSAASVFAVTSIDKPILSASYSAVINGRGNAQINLPNSPITAIASLKIDGVAVSASSAPGNAGYVFDDDWVYLRGDYQVFTRGVQNVEVSYTAGYTKVPLDLAQAVVDMVASKYKRRLDLHVTGRTLDGQTISYTMADLPKQTEAVFDKYRGVVLA
jgi:hypothetical protein